MSKVLILGCGPAGLIAAHTATIMGHDVLIVSKARKSRMYGAQYLHGAIPLATPDNSSFRVTYELRGDVSAYRAKVYGKDYRGTVSPEDLSYDHMAWDIRDTYDWLWETYGEQVHDEPDIGESGRLDKILEWAKADRVISTVPAPLLCRSNHNFLSEYIWSSSTDENWPVAMNTVVCNGEDSPAWYRAANIQGHITIEWPNDKKPPIPGIHHVEKPLSTNCDCYPDIVRMGRYGRWEKGVLSHTAMMHTVDLLTRPEQLRIL